MGESATAKTTQNIHVLHVDDDPSTLEISKQILMDMNATFEIDHALCVDEAFKKLSTTHYDIVVSDYEMPQKNGLHFLKELREQKNEIPFLLFTGKGREEVAITALNLGADGYYNKQGSPETVYGELTYGIKVATEKRKAKQALEESEKRHVNLINQSISLFIVHDLKGQIIEVNPQACKKLGYTQEELLSKNIADLSPDKMGDSIYPKVLRGEQVIFENFMKHKDGLAFPVELTLGTLIVNGNTLIFEFARDLTESKKAQETLRQEHEMLESLTEASGVGLVVVSKDYHVLRANSFIKHYKGDVTGKLCYATFNSLVAPCPDCGVTKIFAGKTSLDSHEYCSTQANGSPYWVEIIATPLSDKKGNVTAAMEITVDITERKKMEENLKLSEEKFRNLSEESPNMIFIHHNGRVVYANKKCEQYLGYTKAEFYAPTFNFLSLCAPEYSEVLKHNFANHLKNQEVPPLDYVLVTRDGKKLNAILNSKLINYEDGKAVLGIVTDITERKKTEATLKDSEEKYRNLFEKAPDVIISVDLTGKITASNQAILQYGFMMDEIVGNSIFNFVPTKYTQKLLEGLKNISAGKSAHGEIEVLTPNGKKITEYNSNPLLVNGKIVGYQTIFRDVTERKKAEQELNMFSRSIQESTDGIVIGDPKGNITYVNNALLKMYGCKDKNDLIGKHVLKLIAEQDRAIVLEKSLEASRTGKSFMGQYTALRTDGSEVAVEVSTSRINNDDGQDIGFVDIIRDVSQRVEAEESLNRAIKKLVLVNEKLNVVGKLTRHDIGNKLSTVNGFAYLLKKKYKDQADIVNVLDKIEQAIGDSERIFEFSRMYEQLGVEDLSYFDVGKAMDQAKILFPGLELKVINDCLGLSLLADSFLRQLFYNFIDNTRKYGGEEVSTIRLSYNIADSGELQLIYEDDGAGISAENKLKLFQEGFSTGGSTGFGLFLSKKMIDIYGWQIKETGEESKGVRFVISIPQFNSKGKINYQIQSSNPEVKT